MSTVDQSHDPELPDLLKTGVLEVEGRLPTASNLTVRCLVADTQVRCVYKPTSGERPLWDFPDGTLGRREVATYTLANALGWSVVPVTVWREDGPFGPGMCQVWLDDAVAENLVDVVPSDEVPADWFRVFEGVDGQGREVSLIHADRPDLMRIALLDAVVNNTDRKGGHVLQDPNSGAVGIDHGVTFAEEDKLRTVLWGWAGSDIPTDLRSDLRALADRLTDLQLIGISLDEIQATGRRLEDLVDSGRFPLPRQEWPAVPWPIF